MRITKVYAAYFSATGTTEKIVVLLAKTIAGRLGIPMEKRDFTLPRDRRREEQEGFKFQADSLVIFGTPVYAGRVPNVLLPFLKLAQGQGALAVPVVLYGNRNYDDSLMELRNLLEDGGFQTIAAGAFVGEHAFSAVLAAGRPDEEDQKHALRFAEEIACHLGPDMDQLPGKGKPAPVKGENPPRPYYTPRDRAGHFIDIRKVKSLVGEECDGCGVCAGVCPMGSISPENVREYSGICIKCGACIKKCPRHARYYVDEGYLYHKTELEEGYARRAANECFFSWREPPLVFRKALESDLPELSAMLDACFGYLERTENYPRWIRGVYPAEADIRRAVREGSLCMASVMGTVDGGEESAAAGMIIMDHHAPEAYQTVAWGTQADEEEALILHTLAVNPLYRGFGIARRLLRQAEGAARERGCRAVRFNTCETNTPAYSLYESCGYAFRGRVDLGRAEYDAPWFRVYEKLLDR